MRPATDSELPPHPFAWRHGLRAVCLAFLFASFGAPLAAHVGLNAPNGGEVLTPGDVATIEWVVLIAHDTENWDLAYSTTGAGGPWIPIATDLPPGNTSQAAVHTFAWTVPNAPSQHVRVRVRMDNVASLPDYQDVSDADLEIVSPAPGTCTPAPQRLCLREGRFALEVDWRDGNKEGSGMRVPETDDSGLFWFFAPKNLEMLVKVLDGCDINGHYWVFAAATTNVQYTLRVVDTEDGASQSYFNPAGRRAPALTDTEAFDCP